MKWVFMSRAEATISLWQRTLSSASSTSCLAFCKLNSARVWLARIRPRVPLIGSRFAIIVGMTMPASPVFRLWSFANKNRGAERFRDKAHFRPPVHEWQAATAGLPNFPTQVPSGRPVRRRSAALIHDTLPPDAPRPSLKRIGSLQTADTEFEVYDRRLARRQTGAMPGRGLVSRLFLSSNSSICLIACVQPTR